MKHVVGEQKRTGEIGEEIQEEVIDDKKMNLESTFIRESTKEISIKKRNRYKRNST